MARRETYRLVLTPAGAGVLSLFLPGLLISAATRQQFLIALGIGSGLLVLINAVLARRALHSIGIQAWGPDVVDAGAPIPINVALSSDRPLECVVGLDDGVRPWIPASVPSKGVVDLAPQQRGVVQTLTTRVRTSAPFGLTAFVRTSVIELAEPIFVAPMSIGWDPRSEPAIDTASALGQSGDPMGLRPFAFGDTQRDVHWPTVARSGALMVRDRRSGREARAVAVTVNAANGDDLDEILGRTRGVVESLLSIGCRVHLASVEQGCPPAPTPTPTPTPMPVPAGDGRRRTRRVLGRLFAPLALDLQPTTVVEQPVAGRAELAKRLALATAGSPVTSTASGRLIVDGEGERWLQPS